MALTPRTEADSKVSIDCSRYAMLASRSYNRPVNSSTNVEVVESLAISVESVVVEFNELLCYATAWLVFHRRVIGASNRIDVLATSSKSAQK